MSAQATLQPKRNAEVRFIQEGSNVELRVDFTVPGSNALYDPTTVTVKVRRPDLTTTTYVYGVDGALVRDSLGKYHLDVTLTQAGVWRWRVEGVVTNATIVDQGQFVVPASYF